MHLQDCQAVWGWVMKGSPTLKRKQAYLNVKLVAVGAVAENA